MNGRICIITLAISLFMAGSSLASGWNATLESHSNLPPRFLAVDKEAQEFYIYTKKSPLKLVRRLPCTTGQRKGDKLVRGDLRTPEGVYFVQRHLKGGLNFELYGDQAFTLNYPNPVDRLKGKTGSGIWIHGRGKTLVPRDTQGCVALADNDLHSVQDYISLGLPVAITTSMRLQDGEMPDGEGVDTATIDVLVSKVKAWAHDWETKSDAFFAYYDDDRFTRSQGSFKAFKRQKERLFRRYGWIRVLVDDIRVLPGPDYWVTYFRQYYRTPTLVTEGIKRLYWQKDDDGELRIVGKEWVRTPTTLNGVYLAGAKEAIAPALEAWRKAWEQSDLGGYAALFADDAVQDGRNGRAAIVEHKEDVWTRSKPKSVVFRDMRYAIVPDGIRVTFIQDYDATSGYSDHGRKTIVMAPSADGWKIVREDWRKL